MKKSIIKNACWNALYKGFTAFFPLVTAAYVGRVLMPEGIGKITYANTIVSYFALLASMGIPNYGIKAIARCGENRNERDKTFSELFWINFISTLVFIVLYYMVVNYISYFNDKRSLFNLMGMMLILNIFNIDWFFQGIEEYGIIAMRGTIVKLLSFIAILIFIREKTDEYKYALILCVALAGNYLFNILKARKFVNLSLCNLHLKKHMKSVIVLLASTLATEVYLMLDTIMLEYFYGESYVAYYSSSMKIVRTSYTLVIALITTLFPRISYYLSQNKKKESDILLTQGLKIIILFALPATSGLIIMADYIILVLFGNQYIPSIRVLRILGILLCVFSVAYLLGHLVLMAAGKEKYIVRATILGAVVNLFLNIVLIPQFRECGAAVASVISEIIVTTILIISSIHYYKICVSLRFIISIVGALILMIGILLFLRGILEVSTLNLAVIIVCSIGSYMVGLFLLKNEFVMESYKLIKNKLR